MGLLLYRNVKQDPLMKKSVVMLALASVFLCSCSSYTCPTYTKKEAKPEVSQTRI
jgi:PBP1b-binding outer membrane lipoprotein LpoB